MTDTVLSVSLDSQVITNVGDVVVFAGKKGDKGTGVSNVFVRNGSLILTLDDNTEINAGELPAGAAGKDGKDGIGRDGRDGLAGVSGKDGKDGVSFVNASILNGHLMVALSSGSIVDVGLLPAGADGRGIVNVSIVNNELVFVMSDDSKINLGNIKGEKGDKGDKGDTGNGISGVFSNGTSLILVLDNGTEINAGELPPGFSNAEIADGHLIIYLTSGATIDAGAIPLGPKGLGFKSASIVNNELILVFDDNSQVNVGDVKGPKGDSFVFPVGTVNFRAGVAATNELELLGQSILASNFPELAALNKFPVVSAGSVTALTTISDVVHSELPAISLCAGPRIEFGDKAFYPNTVNSNSTYKGIIEYLMKNSGVTAGGYINMGLISGSYYPSFSQNGGSASSKNIGYATDGTNHVFIGTFTNSILFAIKTTDFVNFTLCSVSTNEATVPGAIFYDQDLGKFVLIGTNSTYAYIYTSSNGTSWQKINTISNPCFSSYVFGIVKNSGVYYFVCNGFLVAMNDLAAQTVQVTSFQFSNYDCYCFANKKIYIFYKNNNKVFIFNTETNNYSIQTLSSGYQFCDVIFIDDYGCFVGILKNGEVITSVDAINWTTIGTLPNSLNLTTFSAFYSKTTGTVFVNYNTYGREFCEIALNTSTKNMILLPNFSVPNGIKAFIKSKT